MTRGTITFPWGKMIAPPPQGTLVDPSRELITFLGKLLPFPREHVIVIVALVL
jgi:hypothetical protein